MKKRVLLHACALLLGSIPGHAELLQLDLSIYGMD
jgi:hypothetical protein